MPRFHFRFLELFSALGHGTPEDPGGDFSMACWIEALDREAALAWGHVLLGDYMRARFERALNWNRHDGSPIREGWIEDDPETLAAAEDWNIPSCRVGTIPEWHEPWRGCNIRR